MSWVVNCFCGTAIRGEDENQIVRNATNHAKAKHALTVTPEQVLALAEKDKDDSPTRGRPAAQ